MTPVSMTICLDSGKIWNSRGRYWNRMLKRRMFFRFAVGDSFSRGITIQITNCGSGSAVTRSNQKVRPRYLLAILQGWMTSSPRPNTRDDGAMKAVRKRNRMCAA